MTTPAPKHQPIPSAPGYVATEDGRVLSRSGWRGLVLREMQQTMSGGKRYPVVRVTIDGRRVTRNAHRLIAEAFHGPCPDGLQVRHLNGDPTDNRPANLAYGTPKQNAADRVRHGTQLHGAACVTTAKLTPDQVREIRRRFDEGERSVSIASAFDLSPNYVYTIARRDTWKHVA